MTGPQLRQARISVGLSQERLARKAKVAISVLQRAENSPGQPAVTIAQLNTLMQVLRSAGADLSAADLSAVNPTSDTDNSPSSGAG